MRIYEGGKARLTGGEGEKGRGEGWMGEDGRGRERSRRI